jgi:hypothetical protein
MCSDFLLGQGDKALMIGDTGGMHVAQPARQLGVGPGVGELDAALILDRRNRDAG